MLKFIACIAISLFIMQAPLLHAAPANKNKSYFKILPKAPDISKMAVAKKLIADGGRFHYMGTRSKLHGFLLVKHGKIQMIYVTPDQKSLLMGVIYAEDGELVTTKQIKKLAKRNKQVAAIMSGAAQQEAAVMRAGVAEGGIAELPMDPSAVAARANEGPGKKRMPLLVASPGERLIMDLQASSGVLLGNTKAPELLMVVSPNCYFCKKTWDGLSRVVKAGKLQVRLIPIARNPASDESRVAAQLLRSTEPLKAWESYLGGNKKALAGKPDAEAVLAIRANRKMMDRWNIMGTPYLVYRSKGQKVKIVQGRPERMAAIIADLVR